MATDASSSSPGESPHGDPHLVPTTDKAGKLELSEAHIRFHSTGMAGLVRLAVENLLAEGWAIAPDYKDTEEFIGQVSARLSRETIGSTSPDLQRLNVYSGDLSMMIETVMEAIKDLMRRTA